MSSVTMIFLLGLSASLFQSAAGQAVLYPYNCDSVVPICQKDCVQAVQQVCSGSAGPLTEELNVTVKGCSAKYSPYNGVAETNVTCLAGFQNILAISSPAASTCDGKTPTRVGGVIAMDANGNYVPETAYGIFPASNNPNCVVHPGQIHLPVPAQHSLFGTIYDCSSGTDVSVAGSGHINTRRGWQCPVSITSAGLCSSSCILGIWATIGTFGLLAGATMVACFLCSGGAIFFIVEACIKKHGRSLDTIDAPLGSIDAPLNERSTTPGYCSGNGLSSTAFTILPSCLKPAMQMSCESAALGRA